MATDRESWILDGVDSGRGLEEILAGYVGRLNAGEQIQPEEILLDHPTHGPEILEQLQAFIGPSRDPLAAEAQPLGTLGDYTLRRRIGRGGMGVVYEAWEGSMDRRVALKVLPPGIAADERALQRFVREAKTAGQLNHPNVVAVYGMGLKDQTPYYSMEIVDGETLAQLLARLKQADQDAETPFGRKDDLRYFANLAETFAAAADGLQHAHSKGIVHRDIKPSNLILDREGRLRILDFGLAHLEGQDSLTVSGDVIGTPLYMSPEQARRRKVAIDHRTDVYSLGATLYEVLTLRPPFQGEDHSDTLSQIIAREPAAPRRMNPRIPRDLETIVLKCLRKDPQDRYGTAEAMGQDFKRFVRGEVVEARPEGKWERWARRVRRHRGRLFALLTILLLLAACGFLALGLAMERRREALREYERAVVLASLRLLRGDLMAPDLDIARGLYIGRKYIADFREQGRQALASLVHDLEAVVAGFSERYEGHYVLARGLALLDRKADAVDEARKACALEPGFPPARSLLEELGQPLDQPPSPAPWSSPWRRASEASRAQRWEAVIASYDEIIALEALAPQRELYLGSSITHVLARGLAHLAHGDYERAKLDFQAARINAQRYGEEVLEPTLLLARAVSLAGNKDLALSLLRETLARDSQASEATSLLIAALHDSMARDLAGAGRFGEAVDVARESVRLFPSSLGAHLSLGAGLLLLVQASGDWGVRPRTAATTGPFRELEDLSKEVLARWPEDPGVHQFLSKAWEARGDLEQAREAYRRALELDQAVTRKGDTTVSGSDALKAAALAAAGAIGRAAPGAGKGEYFEGGHFDVEGRVMNSCINTSRLEWGIGLSRDGKRLFYGSGVPSSLDLYLADWDPETESFATCRSLSELNSDGWDTGASLSADGNTIYFESTRQGGGQFLLDIFQATWDPERARFVDVLPLAELDAPELRFRPCISASGLELYFNQQLSDWDRNMEIWVAWRDTVGEHFTSDRTRPLDEINSPHDEFTPVIAGDGKTLFWTGWLTNSHDGGPDFQASSLWAATRSESYDPSRHREPPPFAVPRKVRLSPDVHVFSATVAGEWPAEGAKLYFTSCLASQCPQLGDAIDIYSATWHATPTVPSFRRGDSNEDGVVDISDPVATLRALFLGGTEIRCQDAGDANDDGRLDIADAITTLGTLFLGQGGIPAPGTPDCGVDPSADSLGCSTERACR